MGKQAGCPGGWGDADNGQGLRQSVGGELAILGGIELVELHRDAAFGGDLARAFGCKVANLACLGAGPDTYLRDAGLRELFGAASRALVQVMGAANLGNGFYRVHPRRNDRVVEALPVLLRLYPEVDFNEIHFTRHLIGTLRAVCPDRFELVTQELQRQWLIGMARLLELLPPQVLLLWLGDVEPPLRGVDRQGLPCLISAAMLHEVQALGAGLVCHVTPRVVSPPLMLPKGDAHDLARDLRQALACLPGNDNGPHLAAGPGHAKGG